MSTWKLLLWLPWIGFAAAQGFISEEHYEGVYWDPATPGEGFTFDTQAGLGFMTIYTYDGQGEPTFLTAIGTLDTRAKGSERPVFEADVYRTRDFTDSELVGELTLFDRHADLSRLTMRWDEREIELERFVYAYPAEPLGRLAGTWLFVILDEVPEGAGLVDFIAVDPTPRQDGRGGYLQARSLSSSELTRVYHEEGAYLAVTPIGGEPGATWVMRFEANENFASGESFDGDGAGMIVGEEGALTLGYRLSFEDLFAEPDR